MVSIWGLFCVCSPAMLSWSEIILKRTFCVIWEICLQISQVSVSFQGIFNPCALESKSDWLNRENFELNFRCLKLLTRYGWIGWGLCACHICSSEAWISAVQSEVPFIISYCTCHQHCQSYMCDCDETPNTRISLERFIEIHSRFLPYGSLNSRLLLLSLRASLYNRSSKSVLFVYIQQLSSSFGLVFLNYIL